MSSMTMNRRLVRGGLAVLTLAFGYACGAASEIGGASAGAPCDDPGDCASGVCEDGVCVGNDPGGLNRPAGSDCDDDDQCGSGSCVDGSCAAGSSLGGGAACASGDECASGVCEDGRCGEGNGSAGSGGTGGSGAAVGAACEVGTDCASGLCVDGTCAAAGGDGGGVTTTIGPHFEGSGTGFRPLIPGCGPDTADECTGTCEQSGGDPDTEVIRPPATLCFYDEAVATQERPAVVIEQAIYEIEGQRYVHLRVTFDPDFVDNTYGEHSSEGWPHRRGHWFRDLEISDHTELLLTDGNSDTVMHFKIDYISADPDATCGYGSLGALGGDGAVLEGDPECILNVATSLDRNLNHCGFDTCYTSDSPAPGSEPLWDDRMVYEVWMDYECFGDPGFGQAYMTYVHASPAKDPFPETIEVEGGPCPPEWDEPYCPPSLVGEGISCFGTPGDGETPDGGTPTGETPDGGTPTGESCPPNYTLYVSPEGDASCVPIPFAGYPGMSACPDGYELDLASEGRYCLPAD